MYESVPHNGADIHAMHALSGEDFETVLVADTTFIDQNGTGNCPAPGAKVSQNRMEDHLSLKAAVTIWDFGL